MQFYKSKSFDYLLSTTLIIISLFASFFLLKDEGKANLQPDSPSYIRVADQIQNLKFPDLSMRTPAYPIFILLTRMFGGLPAVVYGQIILGAASIVILYKILICLFKQKILAWFIAIILAFDAQVVNYQTTILSETLAVFVMLLFVFSHLLLTQKRTKKVFIFAFIVGFLLMTTKPAFFLLPIMMYFLHLIFTFLIKTTSKRLFFVRKFFVIAIGLNLLVIQGYQLQNFLNHKFWGFSTLKEINLLGKMIQYGYLGQEYQYSDSPEIVQRIITIYREDESDKSPYTVFNKLELKSNKELIHNLSVANRYILANNFSDFTTRTIKLMPEVFTADIFFYGSVDSDNFLFVKKVINSFFVRVNRLKFFFFLAWGLANLFFYLIGFRWRSYQISILLLPVFYLLVTISAFSYGDYARLRLPIELIMNMFVIFPIIFVFKEMVKGIIL